MSENKLSNNTRLIIERRKDPMTMIHINNGVLFQPNLTNEESKERQENPLLFRLVEYPKFCCGKEAI